MKLQIALSALAMLLLSGCNSTKSDQTADTGYRCKQVRSLGSNIPNTYCSTKKQREEAREKAKEAVRNSRQTSVISGGNG
ncbi:hypothetical protein [Pseudoalteromonas sp. R3]|uniref:hypothetical protein n=1 Tax=Pseudoalteromonas sp. R3 TaxID=1709477 RepID=UPI0006B643AF|nr:hypothetical protein [Pseudoalteromonas sp. R3]AZZ97612.1 hypothetical protein ELR70_11065 [Pseudoalteromonas sp. R3]